MKRPQNGYKGPRLCWNLSQHAWDKREKLLASRQCRMTKHHHVRMTKSESGNMIAKQHINKHVSSSPWRRSDGLIRQILEQTMKSECPNYILVLIFPAHGFCLLRYAILLCSLALIGPACGHILPDHLINWTLFWWHMSGVWSNSFNIRFAPPMFQSCFGESTLVRSGQGLGMGLHRRSQKCSRFNRGPSKSQGHNDVEPQSHTTRLTRLVEKNDQVRCILFDPRYVYKISCTKWGPWGSISAGHFVDNSPLLSIPSFCRDLALHLETLHACFTFILWSFAFFNKDPYPTFCRQGIFHARHFVERVFDLSICMLQKNKNWQSHFVEVCAFNQQHFVENAFSCIL